MQYILSFADNPYSYPTYSTNIVQKQQYLQNEPIQSWKKEKWIWLEIHSPTKSFFYPIPISYNSTNSTICIKDEVLGKIRSKWLTDTIHYQ